MLGAILVGGRSRRFGAPKALAKVGNRPLLERVVAAVRPAVSQIVLITDTPEAYAFLRLPTRGDVIGGAGALGGVHSALRWAIERDEAAALCVACDMPFLSTELVRHLAARAASTAADVVAPASVGPLGVEPLCAVYLTSCMAQLERRLHAGEHRLGDALGALRLETVPLAEVRRYGEPEQLFLNVNTPAQHALACRLAEHQADERRHA